MVTDSHDDWAEYKALGGRKGSKDEELLAQRTWAVSLYPATLPFPLSEIFKQRSKKWKQPWRGRHFEELCLPGAPETKTVLQTFREGLTDRMAGDSGQLTTRGGVRKEMSFLTEMVGKWVISIVKGTKKPRWSNYGQMAVSAGAGLEKLTGSGANSSLEKLKVLITLGAFGGFPWWP